MSLANDITAAAIRAAFTDRLEALCTAHYESTGETQPELASRMWPDLAPNGAARKLREIRKAGWVTPEALAGLALGLGVAPQTPLDLPSAPGWTP